MTLHALHRASAAAILVFAVAHTSNHLIALSSIASHIAFMNVLRLAYRQPVIEAFLLSCVAFQIASGLWFAVKGWRRSNGIIALLQLLSGAYLAFFLLVHVGAVLFGRSVLQLDTNFYFAAAGMHVAPYQLFFAPYYFFAVLALCAHIGCAAYWQMQASSRRTRALIVAIPMLLGGVLSLGIVLALAGKFCPFEVPVEYMSSFSTMFE